MTMAPIHIVGAGGIGVAVGYALRSAGVPVTFVEADAAKVEWGRRHGVGVDGLPLLSADFVAFADFQPRIPERFRKTPYVLLANIHPRLQLDVLEQVERPEVTGLDTMNYWIERTPEELRTVLARIDILLINDSEVRQLANEPVLRKAAVRILEMGPELLVAKKGEDGAVVFSRSGTFAVPGLPLDSIVDPTGTTST